MKILNNPNPNAPLIVCYGGGVDSTAVLVLFWMMGIIPDLILFANTHAEKPETTAYIHNVMQPWLRSIGFPEITIVQNNPKDTTGYTSLYGQMMKNETLPPPAFGMHSCSVTWKVKPQDYFLRGASKGPNKQTGWQPALDAWARGVSPIKVVGYDDSTADRKRAGKVHGKVYDPKHPFDIWLPLQDLGFKRAECVQVIRDAGLPVPMKSACYFCPSSKAWEVWWLAGQHPDLFIDALKMEMNSLRGRHSRVDVIDFDKFDELLETGKSYPSKKHCAGLGRSFSWCKLAHDNNLVDFDTWTFTGDAAVCFAKADDLRTDDNALDGRSCPAVDLVKQFIPEEDDLAIPAFLKRTK